MAKNISVQKEISTQHSPDSVDNFIITLDLSKLKISESQIQGEFFRNLDFKEGNFQISVNLEDFFLSDPKDIFQTISKIYVHQIFSPEISFQIKDLLIEGVTRFKAL
ncbi:MAG: hypothetical protein ISN64_00065 [Rickettsia sp.]|nr:hypothetical protein [Rickettsia sp.]